MIGIFQFITVAIVALYVLRDTKAGRSILNAAPTGVQDAISEATDYLPTIELIAGGRTMVDTTNMVAAIDSIKSVYPYLASLPTSLVLGIVKVESGGNALALSGSNARGLMQVLPSTAYYVIDKFNLGIPHELEQLYYPGNNLIIGMHYIKYLIDMYNGDVATAIQAYNMGPGNIAKGRGNTTYLNKVYAATKTYTSQGIA